MPWVRLDDTFAEHPKLRDAGPLGLALQVAALCYCNRYLTDGHVSRAAARTLLDFGALGIAPDVVVGELVAHGVWHDAENGCGKGCGQPRPGGFLIHDYAEFQPSKETVEQKRREDAERKRKGRLNREARPNGLHADSDGNPPVPSRPVTTPLTPREAGGIEHSGQHPNCRRCGTSRRSNDATKSPTEAQYERTARRINGKACPTCLDSYVVEPEVGRAMPCPDCQVVG